MHVAPRQTLIPEGDSSSTISRHESLCIVVVVHEKKEDLKTASHQKPASDEKTCIKQKIHQMRKPASEEKPASHEKLHDYDPFSSLPAALTTREGLWFFVIGRGFICPRNWNHFLPAMRFIPLVLNSLYAGNGAIPAAVALK